MNLSSFYPLRGLRASARHALLTLSLAASLPAAEPAATWQTDFATFGVDATGSLSEITRASPSRPYLAPGQPAPVLSLRIGETLHTPTRASWEASTKRLTLRFSDTDATAVVGVEPRPTHVRFELLTVQSANPVDVVVWGPYPTIIGDIIGETIGVVRDPEFAVGIQTLNAKTLGGYPTQENDGDNGHGADDPGRYPDLPPELGKDQSFRGDTALRTEFGSVLQGYCRNRDRDRIVANWGHDRYLVPAFADGGVVGSKIALFACPAAKALETLGAIELAEGLPHPLIDGVWGKTAPNANSAYLIVDFSEESIGLAIDMTKRAGLRYLYHSSPFETWGHFQLKPSLFPNGWDGFRNCVRRAQSAGVRVGFHNLSNFITPNDPYVTPKPDPRLARIGTSSLSADLDATQKELRILAPDFFMKNTDLNTVRVGDELIRYAAVSTNAPWRLLDCERGAWGTTAAAHPAGAEVAKLMDHSYRVFLTDADLAQEVARNIARFCNATGAQQLSFDGLEGNWSTGMGQYGRTLFTLAWYDALTPELRGQIINDASNPGHFNWHIYTRMNWGEPWYAGFRESQTLYRFKNQLYFERNLMPRMLGWFALRADTSLEDAEWLLARAAGFNAGFALAASLASQAQLEADPHSADAARLYGALPAILDAIRQWETARMAGAFPPAVRAALRDNTREFHLEPAGDRAWDLSEFHLERLTHDTESATPAKHSFQNPYPAQPLQWTLRNESKHPLTGLVIHLNGQAAVRLGDTLIPPGGALRYRGGATAAICDAAWKEVAPIAVAASATQLAPGPAEFSIGCPPQPGGKLKVELRTVGPPTPIRANRP